MSQAQIMATYNAETATLRLSKSAYEFSYYNLAVGANIMIGHMGGWLGWGFAAYAKVKSVKADQNGVDVELTTDGMNIKGVYAKKHMKESFVKMKSGGVKVSPLSAVEYPFQQNVGVELKVKGANIMMKAKEKEERVMTYNNATDTFSSISIKRYFEVVLNEGGAILIFQTKDGDEMRVRVEVLGRSQGASFAGWSLKINDKLMSKMTKDIIKRGRTDILYNVGVGHGPGFNFL